MSSYAEPGWARRLLARRPRGVGYLLKDTVDDTAVLRDALHRVAHGGVLVDPKISAQVAVPAPGPDGPLSPREIEVLREMAEGRSNAGVATALSISVRTVENHIRRLLPKIGVFEDPDGNARVRAALWWRDHGENLGSSTG
ncbi:response regulator transcription factor [Actinomycetospora termitidis]|uniref:response regulator transcription factor n=1 Tax=Actinomycetospora termitidis TaxID=3053470 RepID=UPI0031F2ED63